MSDIAIIFAIVGAVVVLFVWDRLPVVIVAMGTALALYATGVLDLGQALGRLRRLRGDLHRGAVRGQRRAGDHRA